LINRLALGTVQFGINYGIANQHGKVSRAEAKLMLKLASDCGIEILDTAISYGDSEACLGEAGALNFKLITKLPPLSDSCCDVNAWVYQKIATSLTNLGVTSIYGLLLHRPEQLLGINGSALYIALQSLKDKGLVQKVGVSIYDPAELMLLLSKFNLDLVQAPFNIVDRRFQLSGCMYRLKDRGIEIHTRSVFLQGLLLMEKNNMPHKFSVWNNLWIQWYQWLSDNNVSSLKACLSFPLSFPEIDHVVVGAESCIQLSEILLAMNSDNNFIPPDFHCDDQKLINPSNWPSL
jgi:aryl-alcohol dehydrogenase-like predicted oxidoreductase